MQHTTTSPSIRAPGWLRGLEGLINAVGTAVSWLALFMVLVTTLVVILRHAFGIGSIPLQEASAYMHSALFLVGGSYALLHDAHVRVDVLYRAWPRRRQAMIDIGGTLFLLLPSCIFMFWVSLDYVRASWRLLEGSPEAGGLPGVFLVKSLIPVSALLLILAGVARLARALLILKASRSSATEEEPDA